MASGPRTVALACAALLWPIAAVAFWPIAAAAQLGHPALTEERPRALHLRLADCDAVALGTIEAVEPGRIRVGAVRALRGELPAQLELKRAPSTPPPLAAQERALLLLRGARSPYLLADQPEELWKLSGEQEEAAAQAIRALDAAETQQEVAALYAEWLARSDAMLARVAAQGFEGDPAVLERAPEGTGARLAAAALGSHDAALRSAALRAALGQEAARSALLRGLPGAAADPDVVVRALSAGLASQSEAARDAALRCLAHDSPQVRAAVLRLSVVLPADPALRASIGRLASDDPDEQVRLAARRVMTR